jgi:hypothetical protein
MPSRKLTPKQTASIHHQANNGVSVVALCAKYNLSSSHIYRIKHNMVGKKKHMSTYNGWTNHATWLFYLHHQSEIENWYHEHDTESRKGLDASDIESYFEDLYHELIEGIANIYLTDVILGELRDVNWREVMKTLREEDESTDDTYDANWTEEGALTNYLDHVAENKDRERN